MGPSQEPETSQGRQLLSKGCVQLRRLWPPAWLAQPEMEEELNLKASGRAGGRLAGTGLSSCLHGRRGPWACFWLPHPFFFSTGALLTWHGEVLASSTGTDAGGCASVVPRSPASLPLRGQPVHKHFQTPIPAAAPVHILHVSAAGHMLTPRTPSPPSRRGYEMHTPIQSTLQLWSFIPYSILG